MFTLIQDVDVRHFKPLAVGCTICELFNEKAKITNRNQSRNLFKKIQKWVHGKHLSFGYTNGGIRCLRGLSIPFWPVRNNLRYLALNKLFLSNTVNHVHKFSQVRNWLSFCLMKDIPLVGLLEQETQELPWKWCLLIFQRETSRAPDRIELL